MGRVEAAGPRVLFVDHTGALGGAELCLLDLATHAGRGSAVVLFADGPLRTRLEVAGANVEVLRGSPAVLDVRRDGGVPIRAVAGVAGLVWRLARRARHFDVLYANSQKALVVSALAGALARRPVVWHLHDLLTQDHFGAAQRRLAVTLSRHFVRSVISNSGATRDAYIAAGGRPDHVHVIYNGIDAAPFEAVSAEDVRAVRNELGIGDSALVGLFGRLAPWKGQSVLLEALTRLPGVHALLVGGALFESDREMPATLAELSTALGVGDRVHVLGFRDDVPALMSACDVVVHASTSPEPFGRVIVEGMLAGTPVVATAAGGALELVVDGCTGILVAPGDATALALAISSLMENPGLREALSVAGRRAGQRFSPAAIRDQVWNVIAGRAPVGRPLT